MSDKAYNETEKRLHELELKIQREYATAATDIQAKWNKYMASHEKKLKSLKADLDAAIKSGDAERISKAREVYQRTLRNVTFNNARYNSMMNEITARLTKANEIALKYINDELPKIYMLNYQQILNDIPPDIFAMMDEEAIKDLMTADMSLLPPPKNIDAIKDSLWNKKALNSQILQGIIQGEGIKEISQRLLNVANMNIASAIRNARTMFTSVQNSARQKSFEKGEKDGLVLEKEWIAAHDSRTREAHLLLHGQRVPIDEPFHSILGDIMYPADPTAAPANVYNCRCAIRSHYKGFKKGAFRWV